PSLMQPKSGAFCQEALLASAPPRGYHNFTSLAFCRGSHMPSRYSIMFFVVTGGGIFFALSRLAAADDRPTPEQVFQKRIVPIFQSPDPSSCTQCHLSGVDLKNYILPSSEKTFLSLRDQGLIDLKKPDDSKILRLIAMSEADKGGANLVHEKTRKA